MNFGTCEGIDQHLPEHDHGKVHDQDDRERSRRSSSIAEQDMLPGWMRPVPAPHGGNLSRLPRSFNQLVDYGRSDCITRSTTCLRRARLAVGLDRSLPKIADRVGVFEKKK